MMLDASKKEAENGERNVNGEFSIKVLKTIAIYSNDKKQFEIFFI